MKITAEEEAGRYKGALWYVFVNLQARLNGIKSPRSASDELLLQQVRGILSEEGLIASVEHHRAILEEEKEKCQP